MVTILIGFNNDGRGGGLKRHVGYELSLFVIPPSSSDLMWKRQRHKHAKSYINIHKLRSVYEYSTINRYGKGLINKSIVMIRGKSTHSGYILGNQNKQYLAKSYLRMDSRWWNTQLWVTNYKEEEEILKKGYRQ